ncbi:MAG: TRAP transporter small permease [Flavobacteriaceae bacterium]
MSAIIEALDRILRPVETGFALVGAATVMALMVLGCAEVVTRSALNYPIRGNIEIIEQLMVLVATLAGAYCQRSFGNVRMTLFIMRLSGRRKWFMEVLALLAGGGLLMAYTWGCFLYVQRSYELGGRTTELGFPLWIVILIAAVSLTLLLARILLQLAEALRLVVRPQSPSSIFPTEAETAGA